MKKIIFFLTFSILILYVSSVFAQSWKLLSSNLYGPNFNGVFFTSSDTGYISSEAGGIYKTTDGGQNWHTSCPDTTGVFMGIYFTDSQTGIAVGNMLIVKTTDGGNSWSVRDSFPWGSFSVFFTDKNNGYAVGHGDVVIKTTNGGDSWFLQLNVGNLVEALNSVYFVNKDTGFVVGMDENDYGIIFKTTNAGEDWVVKDSVALGGFNCVFFPNSQIGYIVGATTYGSIIKTTDSGNNWTQISTNGGYSCFFISADTGFIGGWGNYIWETTRGGLNWSQQNPYILGYLYSMYFPNKNTGYAVGADATILKYTNPTDIVEQWTMDNGEWIMYPNPVSNELNIEFNSKNPIPQTTNLSICNLQGKEIYKERINKTINKIDISKLNAGVYIIKIQKATEITITKFIKL